MNCRLFSLLALVAFGPSFAVAEDEYNVQVLNEAAPSDAGLSAEVAAAIAPTGFKVMKGSNRTVCSFWPVKELATNKDFKPTAALLYPLEMGQLVGVINYKRDGEDFRGQEIEAGTYTVRFALQPEDGNHVGTSDTRDFLLLLKPTDDTSAATIAKEALFPKSAAAAGTTHPCMLSLLSAEGTTGALPSVEHDADRELTSVAFAPKTAGGGELKLRLVVVGKAAE
jgi:hypothetical protein